MAILETDMLGRIKRVCPSCSKHCPICGRDFSEVKQNVDHCHETGEYRGVICGPCNRAIGVLGDTVESLERALAYLKGEL